MQTYLPFIVSGVATGGLIGLIAIGLVVTYRTSGVFNFGHGAIATAAAYFFYFFNVNYGIPWPIAMALAIAISGVGLGLILELVGRRLAMQRAAYNIVATVGIILVFEGLATVKYGTVDIPVPQFLPGANETFAVGGVNITHADVIAFAVSVIGVASLSAVMRWSRLGTSMQAMVDDPDLLSMRAINPVRVRRFAWIIGAGFASISGVLLLPFVGLQATILTMLAFQAFGAAAGGLFKNLPATFVSAIVITVAVNLVQNAVVDNQALAGLPDALPYIVLVFVLLLVPRRKLAPIDGGGSASAVRWRPPASVQVLTAAGVLVIVSVIPIIIPSDRLNIYTIGLTEGIIVLSLGLLVRMSGYVSLCQAAFAGFGAAIFSQFAANLGLPWLVSLLLAAAIVMLIGAIVSVSAMRLSGIFLALATFGFGLAAQQALYSQGFVFTDLIQGRAVPRPWFAQNSDVVYYYIVAIFFVGACILVTWLYRSRIGRISRGLSEASTAVSTLGVNPNTTRVIIFSVSAFMAAVGGILYAATIHFTSDTDPAFTPINSLVLLAILALAPFGEPWFGVIAVAASVIGGYLGEGNAQSWLNVIFGVSAIIISLNGGPVPAPELYRKLLSRLDFGYRRRAPAAIRASATQTLPPVDDWDASKNGLTVENLVVRFGGVVAVNGLTFRAKRGAITGLIGPNGAGKTSVFNACSGLNRRASGSCRLDGVRLNRLGPAGRARKGLGRTFQRVSLAESLTVAENVALGREASLAGASVFSQVFGGRRDRRMVDAATRAALELCGVSHLAGVRCSSLSTGQARLVELARCLAGPSSFLLLDEPSAGLDTQETLAFSTVIDRVVRERRYGILLVEHDMSLVMNVCDYIYVLNFGELICEGTPVEVSASSEVQGAYLGSRSIDPPTTGRVTT